MPRLQGVRHVIEGNLLRQFAVMALVVVVGIGLVLAWGLGQLILQNTLHDVSASAKDSLYNHILGRLSLEDFASPMTGDRYQDFHRFVQENVVSDRTVRLKIWNRDGLVTYANDPTIVGETFPIGDELREALRGETATEVSDLQAAENVAERGYRRLIEVYLPVRLSENGEIVGAFEIYQKWDPIEEHIQELYAFTYSTLGLGLLGLYLSLTGIVGRGSRTILKQQRDLEALYRTGQDIRSDSQTQDILHRVIADTTLLVGGDNGVLVLRDTATGKLDAVAGYGPKAEVLAKEYLPALEGLVRQVLQSGTPAVIGEADRLAGFEKSANGASPKSLLCVPLKVRGENIGVLNVTNYGKARAFSHRDVQLLVELAGQAAIAIEQRALFDELRRRAEALGEAYHATLTALSAALDVRDAETENHSLRVSGLTVAVAQKMGIPEEEVKAIEMGAMLHDVGKIGVPDAVLRKPGPLTSEEWETMRMHPGVGYEILSRIPFLAEASTLVLCHHERFDGRGYPSGLAGKDIPIGARIFAVVDTYDAMTSDRPYRKALGHDKAIEEIIKHSGDQFDPEIVDAFLQVIAHERAKGRA